MTASPVSRIGDYIREQRESSRLSLRRLAEESGISNPYLSQIERGLRKPSAEILQQIAKALRISAEQLYVQAGLLEERDSATLAVEAAVLADPQLNERQKRVLLDIHTSFVAESAQAAETQLQALLDTDPEHLAEPAPAATVAATPRKKAAKRSTKPSTKAAGAASVHNTNSKTNHKPRKASTKAAAPTSNASQSTTKAAATTSKANHKPRKASRNAAAPATTHKPSKTTTKAVAPPRAAH